jgi:hypothetical protein
MITSFQVPSNTSSDAPDRDAPDRIVWIRPPAAIAENIETAETNGNVASL